MAPWCPSMRRSPLQLAARPLSFPNSALSVAPRFQPSLPQVACSTPPMCRLRLTHDVPGLLHQAPALQVLPPSASAKERSRHKA